MTYLWSEITQSIIHLYMCNSVDNSVTVKGADNLCVLFNDSVLSIKIFYFKNINNRSNNKKNGKVLLVYNNIF